MKRKIKVSYDLVITGNGILGYALAFEIIKLDPHIKLAIIGPSTRESSAATAAGAMLNAFAEVTNKTLASKPSKIKLDMAVQASKLWPAWIEEINSYLPPEENLAIHQGTHIILNTKSGKLDDENYNSIIEALDLYDEPYETHVDAKIAGVSPSEAGRFVKSLYLASEGAINTSQVLHALHHILTVHKGVTILDDKVIKINVTANKISGVQTLSGHTYNSPQVVLATGAFSQHLINELPSLKDKVPLILAGVGYSVLLKQIPDNSIRQIVRTPNRAGACGLHVLPRNEETLYLGASNNVYLTPCHRPTVGLLNFLLECAVEQINQEFYKSEVMGWHVGNRPATLDTFPLIGETSLEGLWFLTGTYRDGFHQSPLLAKNLAKGILGQPHDLPDLFKPERQLIQTRTREESIAEFSQHYLSGSYEHNIRLPKFITDQEYISLMRPKVEQWYEQLETDYNLSPDMLLMFNFAPNVKEQLSTFKNYFKTQKVQTQPFT